MIKILSIILISVTALFLGGMIFPTEDAKTAVQTDFVYTFQISLDNWNDYSLNIIKWKLVKEIRMPLFLETSGDELRIHFSVKLTKSEEAKLKKFMSRADFSNPPSRGYKLTLTIKPEEVSLLLNKLGISHTYIALGERQEIYFDTLTETQKKTVKNIWNNFIVFE